MNYKEEITKAMEMLSEVPNTLFIGQSVLYEGSAVYETLGTNMMDRIEVPVFEDTQLGLCIGLALEGYLPICIFPRMDFLMCAMNQLVNHLDKIEEMSVGRYNPKVIIRTMVGSRKPLYPGAQHCQDYTEALKILLKNINILVIEKAEQAVPFYSMALESPKSSIVIESTEKIRE